MTLSLIQTSQNRKSELKRFVASLNVQEGIILSEIQLIFVDQGNSKEIFNALNNDIMLTYISTQHCSLSHARNLALPYVKGKYVGFPDDDCWYEPNTLANVLSILDDDKYDGVTGKGTNEKGRLTSVFPDFAQKVEKSNRCAAISYTMFYKFIPSVTFDENMGVGSPYNLGAGEETDYLLNLMEQFNYRVLYAPHIIVHHPVQDENIIEESNLAKAYSYARGAGYLMHKHRFPLHYYLRQFLRPIGGVIYFFIMGDIFRMKKSYLLFRGRLEGLFYRVREK